MNALLDEELDAALRRNPLQATVRGVEGYNHLLPDLSLRELERERARERLALARQTAIDPEALAGEERISHELLLDRLRSAVEAQSYRDAEGIVLSTLGGVQNMMPRAAQVTAFRTVQDYRDYTQRLRATPRLVDDTIERLKAGMRSRWMSALPVVTRVVAAIDAHVVDDVDKSALLGPFREFAGGIAQSERAELTTAARDAIADEYQPALRRFRSFLLDEYQPMAPDAAGLTALPGGRDYYEFLIRSAVVQGKGAAEIHALGLREVARIRGEIGALARSTGHAEAADTFIEFMRTDPGFFFTSAEEVLATYRALAERIDPQLPKLFHAVPRMRYEVRAMTPPERASSTAANYTSGSLKLGTPGYFTIDALGHAGQARWRSETLFAHEAVPGHHMQIARAGEIEGLHPWRTMLWNVAYGEGWALYAEKLGFDIGLFTDPCQKYGHLQAELLRAARLVADTGIHYYGWTREQAIDYMAGQGGVAQDYAVSEVDRYFSNPSQALGYMLGQLKFLELRRRAERALGAKFDARDFHAVAIDHGSMPLAVLERRVDQWLCEASPPAH